MTIAIWCILIAGTLPYVAFNFVKGLDARQPRAGVGGLDGRAARAYGAQLNGFETFPIFAAAVIVSHVVGGPSRPSTCPGGRLRPAPDRPHGRLYRRSPAPALGRLHRGATGRRGDFHPSRFSLTSERLPERRSASARDVEERAGHVGGRVADQPYRPPRRSPRPRRDARAGRSRRGHGPGRARRRWRGFRCR